MNYTIYVGGEAEVMTKYLVSAEAIAEDWDLCQDVYVVDNATGEIVREYPAVRD